MVNKMNIINSKILKIEKEIKNQHDNGLSGSLVEKYIKCGKKGCKCSQGYKHGPYLHIQYYKKGKLKTFYIKRKDEEEYKRKLEENNKFRKNIKRLIRLYRLKIKLTN